MNPEEESDDFGDHLTFHLAPPAGQTFHLSCETSQPRVERMAQELWLSENES